MRDPLPIRLGGLAANLARIGSTASNPANREAVLSMLYESKYFIEWTAAEFGADIAGELAELQIEIAMRESRWKTESAVETSRAEFGAWAKDRSRMVLDHSGLLNQ